jgi:hypothetical protein
VVLLIPSVVAAFLGAAFLVPRNLLAGHTIIFDVVFALLGGVLIQLQVFLWLRVLRLGFVRDGNKLVLVPLEKQR